MEEEAKEVGLDWFNATIRHDGTLVLNGITVSKFRLLQCTFWGIGSLHWNNDQLDQPSWTSLDPGFLQNLKFRSQLNGLRSWAGISSS